MNNVTFRSAHVGETRNLAFDFISLLALGETISSAVASYAVYSGATAATATLGSPATSGTIVTVAASSASEGVTFLVTVTVVTSLSQTLKLSGFLAMTPAGM
jgi:hypothetical protein